MKLIHITPSYKPATVYGGPIISVAKLCEELVSADQNVLVLTTTANGKEELQVPLKKKVIVNGVNIQYYTRITKDHTHFSPSLVWHLYLELKKTQNVIVHIHSWWNLVAIFCCLIARYKKIPVVLSPRGMLSSYSLKNRNVFFKLIIHRLLGNSLLKYCHIHATSTKEKLDVLKIQQPKSITTIPNFGIFPSDRILADRLIQTESPQNLSAKPFKLLYLSRIDQKKGLDILFHALQLLNFPWILTIAGSAEGAYAKKLQKIAYHLKISASIQWIGQVNDNNKLNIFSEHDLFVLFSHNENFANVVLESLSIGTPVAISKHVGLADYVVKNDLGWVAADLNHKTIAKTIASAQHNFQKRSRINRMAPTLVKNHFADQMLLTKYLKLYKDRIE